MPENMMNSAHKASNELSRRGWDLTFGSVKPKLVKKDKLRLLLFEKCNRRCAGCVNDNHDLDKLPVEKDYTGYTQVILTGGEPMLDSRLVAEVALEIRKQNHNAFIILQTAKFDTLHDLIRVWNLIDGITVTLHVDTDFVVFKNMVTRIKDDRMGFFSHGISKRVNVVSGMLTRMNWEDVHWLKKSGWEIKSMPWKKDCPLPEGEVLKRLHAPKPKLSLSFGGD